MRGLVHNMFEEELQRSSGREIFHRTFASDTCSLVSLPGIVRNRLRALRWTFRHLVHLVENDSR